MLYAWLKTAFPDAELPARFTVQAGLAAACGFFLSLACGAMLIAWFRRRGVVEDVAKPDSATLDRLHSGKKNTPTMGGLMILAAAIAATLLCAPLGNFYVQAGLLALAALGALGFVDDYVKLHRRPKKGIRARTKLAAQLLVGAALGWLLWRHTQSQPDAGRLFLPLLAPGGISLGAWSIALTALLVAGMSNAVNLTDGVDGLAGGCAATVILLLAGLAYVVSHAALSAGLGIAHVPEARALAVMLAALGGATLGFLWYNAHPAQIFMGDTGSLPLGGMLGYVAVALRQEALVLIVGAVFIFEMLSVVLQVASFKLTGRRIFLCSPFHHHCEFAGWPETKVTARFWIVTMVVAFVALGLFRVQ